MSAPKKPDDALLNEMHGVLTQQLLARIKSGEATAADFNVARQLLKDNNIQAVPVKDSPLQKLTDAIPEFEDDDAIPQHSH